MDVNEILRTQWGVITRRQALDAGLSRHQIDHRLRTGQWIREHQGTFRLAGARSTWESRLLSATLASGGVASHRCGAALWYLDVYANPRAEITVPHGSWGRLDGVTTHFTTQWDRVQPTVKRGLDCLRNHSIRGRSGCLNLRRVLEMRLGDRVIPLSDFSRLVANLLVDGGVQAPVVSSSTSVGSKSKKTVASAIAPRALVGTSRRSCGRCTPTTRTGWSSSPADS